MTFDPKDQFLLSTDETERLAILIGDPVLQKGFTHSLAIMMRSGCTLEMSKGVNGFIDTFLSLADKPQAIVSPFPKLTTYYANPSQRPSPGGTASNADATHTPTGKLPVGPDAGKG